MRKLILLLLAAASSLAQAQFPAKPIRIISGAPPGSPGDVAARIIAEPLGAALGQPV
jgi:tripartite-type tricarboxylate transporter receptor subunit TctC